MISTLENCDRKIVKIIQQLQAKPNPPVAYPQCELFKYLIKLKSQPQHAIR